MPVRRRGDYTNQKSGWAEQVKLLELKNNTIASLVRANKRYSKASLESASEIIRLNEALCFQGDPAADASSGSSSFLQSFDEIVRGASAGTRQKLGEIATSLGLSKGRRQTDADRSSKLAAGMRKLFDYYFEGSNGDNLDKCRKLMCSILLSDDFFGNNVGF